ncbi:MAG TPA: adenylyl-sulfate kinase [Polyangiaceae bacterium]|nr:adenylyl-sulfate kinase [Polyangiaceae bacterium]
MRGAIVWFTGLPSSGKSRLARRVQLSLVEKRVACCMLDGDRVRSLLHPTPGYSNSERNDFYLTLGELSLELAEQGLIVLVPATANRRAFRDRIRERAPHFLEVWMTAPLEECRARDGKGLYAQTAGGQVQGLPGADSAYEAPEAAELTATGGDDDDALAEIIRAVAKVLAQPSE